MKFKYDWSQDYPNTKVPKSVKFPDGTDKFTSYMRDGLILFSDGTSATYERDGDRCAEFNMIESLKESTEAINDYMKKQIIGRS